MGGGWRPGGGERGVGRGGGLDVGWGGEGGGGRARGGRGGEAMPRALRRCCVACRFVADAPNQLWIADICARGEFRWVLEDSGVGGRRHHVRTDALDTWRWPEAPRPSPGGPSLRPWRATLVATRTPRREGAVTSSAPGRSETPWPSRHRPLRGVIHRAGEDDVELPPCPGSTGGTPPPPLAWQRPTRRVRSRSLAQQPPAIRQSH